MYAVAAQDNRGRHLERHIVSCLRATRALVCVYIMSASHVCMSCRHHTCACRVGITRVHVVSASHVCMSCQHHTCACRVGIVLPPALVAHSSQQNRKAYHCWTCRHAYTQAEALLHMRESERGRLRLFEQLDRVLQAYVCPYIYLHTYTRTYIYIYIHNTYTHTGVLVRLLGVGHF